MRTLRGYKIETEGCERPAASPKPPYNTRGPYYTTLRAKVEEHKKMIDVYKLLLKNERKNTRNLVIAVIMLSLCVVVTAVGAMWPSLTA